ncbi:MAG TPA: hypothetical protein VMS31_16500 [Pyrinomonadaceae bacterium]|nr:hypothetical protein [Pyrinomonadaceae bacterium]
MTALTPPIPRHLAGILTGGLAAGPPTTTPATGTIVFFATINDKFLAPVSAPHEFVDKHDPINNCVRINGMVLGNMSRPTPINAPLISRHQGNDSQKHTNRTLAFIRVFLVNWGSNNLAVTFLHPPTLEYEGWNSIRDRAKLFLGR